MKTVSVIVPVYNAAADLTRCVSSLLAQSQPPQEILLIDDGSTDGSAALCDRLQQEHPSCIRVIHQRNQGKPAAMNRGLSLVRGEVLSFIDADDYVEPDMFERLCGLMEQHKAGMAAGEMIQENGDSRHCRQTQTGEDFVCVWDRRAALVELCCCRYLYESVCTAIFSREAFLTSRFPLGRTCEDHAILHELIAACDRVVYCAKPFYHYVQHGGSVSRGRKLNLATVDAAADRLRFYKRYYPELLFAAETDYAVSCMSVYTDSVREQVPCPKDTLARLRHGCLRYLPAVIRNPRLPTLKKLQAACFCFCLPVYRNVIARTEHR